MCPDQIPPVSLPSRILVALDGSEESLGAAQYAIELASLMKAQLSAIHVILIPEYVSVDVAKRLEAELKLRGEDALKAVGKAAREKQISIRTKVLVTTKSVVSSICDFARADNADMIVVGTRGAGGVAKVMLGSVAAGVAREADCPVLVVR